MRDEKERSSRILFISTFVCAVLVKHFLVCSAYLLPLGEAYVRAQSLYNAILHKKTFCTAAVFCSLKKIVLCF